MANAPGPVSGGGRTGTAFLDLVEGQIGTPYVWGGDAPGGFDCSGLVYWAAHALGIKDFPRTSEEQWAAVDRIKADQLQPGDLIFMNFPGEAAPGHVVIYRGGDSIVQAPSTGQLVQEDSYTSGTAQQWGATIVGYGRIPGLDYAGEPVTKNLGSGGTTAGGGGGGGSHASWWDAIWTGIQAGFGISESIPGNPASAVPAISDTAQAVLVLADPIQKLVNGIDWLFHPNHWIRIMAGVAGGGLVLGGAFQLSHTGGEIPVSAYGVSTSVGVPQAASLPLGVLFVGLGGVLLFVAFHNLPPGINTFPDFLGYLSDEVKIGSAKAKAA